MAKRSVQKLTGNARRAIRTRFQIKRQAGHIDRARPRLSVFRSNKHIYAQVIDDVAGRTLAAASSLEADVIGAGKGNATRETAAVVGKLVAERALKVGVEKVVFDRGEFRYHGQVSALANEARESGLNF